MPASSFMSVVLPAPLGPTRPIRSPARTSNARSVKTGSPAYWRPRPWAEIRIKNTSTLVAEGPLRAEHVVVMLGEPVGLVANVLEQAEGERTAAEDDGVGAAGHVDLFFAL